ncbi:DUF3810 domain-containing protein [Chryseobacterium sp. CT-SW4]|uniref:DUF3810 domain-containing protein n=1 Tax=Chryseobacterium sp. SW-1 TaxID=3157343 RepID=UPI003B029EA5
MLINSKRTYHKKRFWATVLVVQILLFFAFSRLKAAIAFFELFFEIQKKVHQLLFSWIPFSIGDILYVTLGAMLVYYIFKAFKKKSRHSSVLKILIVINIFYFSYQLFWGMLYFQTPIIEKLPDEKPTEDKAKKLALLYLEKCRNTRAAVKEDRNGVFRITNICSIQQEILFQQNQLPPYISNKKSYSVNSFKPSLFKRIMNFTGILGYYNPFTAEAQYNSGLPSSYIPFTLAHESSHQLGFAREQEANFIGYLIGVNSNNAELRYSTEYFTLKSLLNSLVEKDPAFVKSVLDSYSPAMKRDRQFEKNFVLQHQGLLEEVFYMTNNLFLKSNQQEGSVTYSYFIELLLRFERV